MSCYEVGYFTFSSDEAREVWADPFISAISPLPVLCVASVTNTLLIHLYSASDSHLRPCHSLLFDPQCLWRRCYNCLVSVLHRVVRSVFLEHRSNPVTCLLRSLQRLLGEQARRLPCLSSIAHPNWTFQTLSLQASPTGVLSSC